jgi:streptomycin 6-kinase
LLHQDLHGGNVLAARREPWLAIDPKPLAGEREFGPAPIVRSVELGRGEAAMRRRLDRLTGELGLDRERVRGWAFAQAIAWAFERAGVLPGHLETARWLLDG